MEIFAVIVGIGISYAIYRKKRQNREEDFEEKNRYKSRNSG